MADIDRTDSGRVVLRLDEDERTVLRSLAEQIIELVAAAERPDEDPLAALVGIDVHAERPSDPAVARLLPDAYRDDEEAASDFRRFTERALRDGKVANARSVLASLEGSGEKLVLSDAEVHAWVGFLNDARLALGTRLEITEESHDDLVDLPEGDPRFGWMQLYSWLTYLQDSVVELLLA